MHRNASAYAHQPSFISFGNVSHEPRSVLLLRRAAASLTSEDYFVKDNFCTYINLKKLPEPLTEIIKSGKCSLLGCTGKPLEISSLSNKQDEKQAKARAFGRTFSR